MEHMSANSKDEMLGLAADGESGARRLRAEMLTVLTLLGAGGVAELGSSAVRSSDL
jgi:hypothetical protein